MAIPITYGQNTPGGRWQSPERPVQQTMAEKVLGPVVQAFLTKKAMEKEQSEKQSAQMQAILPTLIAHYQARMAKPGETGAFKYGGVDMVAGDGMGGPPPGTAEYYDLEKKKRDAKNYERNQAGKYIPYNPYDYDSMSDYMNKIDEWVNESKRRGGELTPTPEPEGEEDIELNTMKIGTSGIYKGKKLYYIGNGEWDIKPKIKE